MLLGIGKKLTVCALGAVMCMATGGALAADVIKVKIAYENNVGEPNDKAVREWGRLMKERSKGQVEFQYFPSSMLGAKKDVMEQMIMGGNVITIADGGFFMDYVPEFGVTFLPYLFDTKEELFKLVDSDLFKGMSKKLEAKGMYIVHSKWIYGVRNMLATKAATKPEDLQGLKIRVPNIRISHQMMTVMGATATPMPLAEAYPALMQGVINGAENPIPVLYGGKMYEGAKFLLMTRHQLNLSSWVAGTPFISKLSPEIVKMLKDTGEEAGRFLDKENEIADKEALQKMQAAGVKVVEVDREAFKKVMKDFPARFFSKELPAEVMDQVYAIIGHK